MSAEAIARLREAESARRFEPPQRVMVHPDDLRALLDAHAALEAVKARKSPDYARGVADERARVVADLVKSADRTSDDKTGPVKIVLLNAAIRFERGEHEEGK